MIRDELVSLPEIKSHVLILSGIRRCGKSTLLFQLLRERHPGAIYLNFDDPRLFDFGNEDFSKLDNLLKAAKANVLMFDEIQFVKNWERYIRQKLDESYQIFITGSNASLLSREAGTSLTGRQITHELFPFSYQEYCVFRNFEPGIKATKSYLVEGGFPEYLKQKNEEILTSLLNDIIARDIAVRYNIRDIRSLQRMVLYLISNVGNRISANRLKAVFDISSASTILDYFSHLVECYLISFVPMFDYSLKKQNVNPKKVYVIDSGLVEMITPRFKQESGHKLENLVFLDLRRKFKEIFYYSGKAECDFVVSERGMISKVIQVCADLNRENLQREIIGLIEAMKVFKLQKGIIVTLAQTDFFIRDGLQIDVLPFHQFAIEKS